MSVNYSEDNNRTAVVVGLQFGDEGKGKITDFLSESYDVVVRFNGGTNAGHTVVVGNETYKFHLLPSGSLRTKVVVLGSGMVIDPQSLISEIEIVKKNNSNLAVVVSSNAHVVTKIHKYLDVEEEKIRSSMVIGTTAQGIGPTYEDKYARSGLRMIDLLDYKTIIEKLDIIYRMHENLLSRSEFSDPSVRENLAKELYSYGQELKKYMYYTDILINKLYNEGRTILFEGAQGVLLDPDFGFYPYVTSSNTISASSYTGTGFSMRKIKKVIGVAKAYVSKVGAGPFPTELNDDLAKKIRDAGGEYGTTTGRPRRVGWLDVPLLKYAVQIDDVDEIALTKVDTLGILHTIKVCYSYELDGKQIDYIPKHISEVSRVKPLYEEFEGWGDLSSSLLHPKMRKWEIPQQLRRYIDFIEEQIGRPVTIISSGKDRSKTVRIER
ncbi:adenylosuccinate synthase [Thermoplasma volcanium GSS1]|uniref:Adenylosuccinate synthetase n=1 Tax=Thermoplasma volcanium (strain ATCC 51530 / DSM 4299 / JCM 9571 / NBRC 15438 / GSS1) TaxID=273116 RepID=PURA_THEVO|nr:adenylosuccinate synthase [Thermoplasma volcanium]Q97C15.1 RecName: Full=Adenylosuccinate synthetase; Short=AMPSase; Short=AdSS; AltName: Full=IMP--aspartate ligase [Thermoplasma volcanium GSS1]BAB59432.1 adenylosuccinate synthase [Thermoplasma volcanium GSS1]